MRKLRHYVVICAFAVTAVPSAALSGVPVDWSGCAVPILGADKLAAITACTLILDRADLIDADRVRALKIRARALQRAGNVYAAIRDFDEAIKLAPKDAELKVRRGWVAYGIRDYDQAMVFAEQALSLDPQSQPAYTLFGALAIIAGKLLTAKGALDQAIKLGPADVVARFQRFQLYQRMEEQPKALAELDDLLALQTTALDTEFDWMLGREMSYRTMARLERAKLLESMGRFTEAEKASDDFVEADPSAISYGWRAWYRLDRAEFERAQTDLDKAMGYDANFWLLHQLQGHLYRYTKQYERAVASLTRAVALHPNFGGLYWERALALRALHRSDEAAKEALTAIAIDPEFFNRKVERLVKLGYLQANRTEPNFTPAVRDAIKACMLDEGCW